MVKKNLPRIVCMGGGTGLSVLLRGLKQNPLEITAIVTVSDNGGSSGRLREDMDMPPPGDIRNVLIALADMEPLLEKVFQYRFRNGEGLKGHSLGNLMLAAMKELTGDFTQAVKEMSRVLAVRGQVLPASRQDVQLVAQMEDGCIVTGESQITSAKKRIHRVSLVPSSPEPLEEAIVAINEADAIVIGPGSIYTSILPNLLVNGMVDTLQKSKACKIFVCNVMTQLGETDSFTASDHVQAIYDHVGKDVFDKVIVNNQPPSEDAKRDYAKKHQSMVIPDVDRLQKLGCEVILGSFLLEDVLIRHHEERVSQCIIDLVTSCK